MKKNLLLLLFCGLFATMSAQTETLTSPDGKLMVKIDGSSGQLRYSVYTADNPVPFLEPSVIGLEMDDCSVLGRNPKVTKKERKSVNQEVNTPFYRKSKIKDQYNELKISFKGNYQVIFRAYNSGVAYRFIPHSKTPSLYGTRRRSSISQMMKTELLSRTSTDNQPKTVTFPNNSAPLLKTPTWIRFSATWPTTDLLFCPCW